MNWKVYLNHTQCWILRKSSFDYHVISQCINLVEWLIINSRWYKLFKFCTQLVDNGKPFYRHYHQKLRVIFSGTSMQAHHSAHYNSNCLEVKQMPVDSSATLLFLLMVINVTSKIKIKKIIKNILQFWFVVILWKLSFKLLSVYFLIFFIMLLCKSISFAFKWDWFQVW